MTRATTAWEIARESTEPKKLSTGTIDVERTLEDWVEKHPDLVEPGLVVLARQLETDGGPLDLLCLDADGRLVIVELKRDRAYRLALAQVLDYAACLATLSYDELKPMIDGNRRKRGISSSLDDVLKEHLEEDATEWAPDSTTPRIVLVGTGGDAALRRIVDYLTSRFDVPINGVFFDVSVTASGSTILVRSAVVADEQAAQQGRRQGRGGITNEELLALAEERGVSAIVTPILAAWQVATSRPGRPERKGRFWSLGTRADGRTVAAQLHPHDEDVAAKKAWLKISIPKIAADLGTSEAQVASSLTNAKLTSDEDWIALNDQGDGEVAATWISTLYAGSPDA